MLTVLFVFLPIIISINSILESVYNIRRKPSRTFEDMAVSPHMASFCMLQVTLSVINCTFKGTRRDACYQRSLLRVFTGKRSKRFARFVSEN